jgi:hypothetical protein
MVVQCNRGNFFQAKALGRHDAAMAGDDPVARVNEHRDVEAKRRDGVGDASRLASAMEARVLRIGPQPADRAISNGKRPAGDDGIGFSRCGDAHSQGAPL